MKGNPDRPYVAAELVSGELRVTIGGTWKLDREHPRWRDLAEGKRFDRARVVPSSLGKWDSSLILFLSRARRWCDRHEVELDLAALSEGLQRLTARAAESAGAVVRGSETPSSVELAGQWLLGLADGVVEVVRFVGECTLAFVRAALRPHRVRWRDTILQMQLTGAMALPIVGLISFLVGIIVAFQAAIQLRQFGADIYVVNLVDLSIVREMGPVMAAVVLAGRTGAAFASQIGTMVVDEEVDALRTLGISPIDFLAFPRIFALFLMMPLLTLYADALGILGGMLIADSVLDIPATTYWLQSQKVLSLSDFAAGLGKSVVFGFLVGVAGCLRGFQCERSAAGIGSAATSAVVSGIIAIIVADALFGQILNMLGI